MRRPEKNRIAHRGSQYRQTGAKPRDARALHRNQYKQRVENARNGYARGIENGKQQDTGRPPRNESVG